MKFMRLNMRYVIAALALIGSLANAAVYLPRFISQFTASTDFYMRPDGNDACNGTSPKLGTSGNCAVATLNRARALVAAQIAGNSTRNYFVGIVPGRYPVTGTTYFTTADTVANGYLTTYYALMPGNQPHISGGRQITGWISNGDGTYHAFVPHASRADYFGTIYVNGVAREHPIVPDKGSIPFFTAADGVFVYGVGESQTLNCTSGNARLDVSPGNVLNFAPGSQVNFGSSTACGFAANTIYYVQDSVNAGANTIALATTFGGSNFVPNATTTTSVYFTKTASPRYSDNQQAIGSNLFTYTTGGSCAPTGAGQTFVPAVANMCDSGQTGWSLTGDEKVLISTKYTRSLLKVSALSTSQITLANRLISPQDDLIVSGNSYKRINFAVDCCQPGHFYLNYSTGRIDYNPMPGAEATSFATGAAVVYAPYAKELVRVSNAPNDCSAAGVSCTATHPGNIVFKNIIFEHTNTVIDTCETTPSFQTCGFQDNGSFLADAAITLIGSINVTIDGGQIARTGEGGINAIMGSSYWTVKNVAFSDNGAGAIIGGGGFGGQRNTGLSGRQSYEYHSTGTWPATNSVGQLYLADDAGSTNIGDGHMIITNNTMSNLPRLGGSFPAVLLLAHDHLTFTNNTIKDVGYMGTVFAQTINANKFDSNETRAGYVGYNYESNAGTEFDTFGIKHDGYYCGKDGGLVYSYGNLGGTGSPADYWIEENNVYMGATSCAYPSASYNSIVATGLDYSPRYFDGQSSFNYKFRNNIIGGGSNRCNQITGLYGAEWTGNIIYCAFNRGATAMTEIAPLFAISASQYAPFTPPPSYPWLTPQYLKFANNVVVFDTNNVKTSGAFIDAWDTLSSHPSYGAFLGNYYQQVDGTITNFGSSTSFASWQAMTNPAGGTQDAGSMMFSGSIANGVNFIDLTFRSSAIFASSGSAQLCPDGVQRSPACSLGFKPWDPTTAGSSIPTQTFSVNAPSVPVLGSSTITGTSGSQWLNVRAYYAGAPISADTSPVNGIFSLSINTQKLNAGVNLIEVDAFPCPAGNPFNVSCIPLRQYVTLTQNCHLAVIPATSSQVVAWQNLLDRYNQDLVLLNTALASNKCPLNKVSMGLNWLGSGNTIPATLVPPVIWTDIAAAKIKLNRTSIWWEDVANGDSTLNLSSPKLAEYDKIFNQLVANGVSVHLGIVSSGQHAVPGVDFTTSPSTWYPKLATFASALVTRFPQVKFIEFFNEQEQYFPYVGGVGAFSTETVNGQAYEQMLQVVVPAVRSANPYIKIVTMGVSESWDLPFAEAIFANGGAAYVDVVSYHSYCDPGTWCTIVGGVEWRDMLNRYNAPLTQLWVTEIGIGGSRLIGDNTDGTLPASPAPLGAWIDNEQKIDLSRYISEVDPYGIIDAVEIWSYSTTDNAPDATTYGSRLTPLTNLDYGFGMFRSDGVTPKPAFNWLKTR